MAGNRYTYEIIGDLKLRTGDFQAEIRRLQAQIKDLTKQRQQIQSESAARQAPLVAAREQARSVQYANSGIVSAQAATRAAETQRQLDAERKRAQRALSAVDKQLAATEGELAETRKDQNRAAQRAKNANQRLGEAEEDLIKSLKQQAARTNAQERNQSRIAAQEVRSNTVGTNIEAEINRRKAADDEAGQAYRNAVVGFSTAINQKRAAIDSQLAEDTDYTKAVAEAKIAQRRLSAAINKQLSSNEEYIVAQAESAAAIRERAAREKEARLGLAPSAAGADVQGIEARNAAEADAQKAQATRRYFAELNASTEGQAGLAAEVGAAKAEQQIYNKQVQAAAAAMKLTEENSLLLAESEAVLARANAEQRTANAKALIAAGVPAAKGAAAFAEGDVAIKAKIAENEALLSEEGLVSLKLKAQANVLQEKVNAALRAEEKVERERVGTGVPLGGGTFTQNVQQRLQSRNGEVQKAATEYATLGQLAQGALLTTSKFAIAGGIFFGLTTAVHSTFQEASKLETEFALLQNQLQALGRDNEFETLSNGMFEIARNTGVAASELTQLAVQLRGAFADQSAQFINKQVDAAAKIERITGLSTAETTDSLTAIAKTFGVSFKQIGDTAVGLQQRFGVLSKEVIQFSADLAPVAAQAGLSFQKLAAIGASVQQLSGRSGAGLAEALGRVLSGLQDNAADILSVYQTNGKLLDHQSEVANDLARGKTGAVLERLIQDYGKLSKAQQNLVNSALGGSRQAPVLSALFGGDTIKKELDRINSGASDAGKLESQFKRLQGTIGQVLAQVRQVLVQVGVGIAESGILDAIKSLIQGFTTLLEYLRPLAQLVKSANDAFGGLATKLLAVYAAMKLIKALQGLSIFSGAAAAAGGGAAGAAGYTRFAAPAAGAGLAAATAGAETAATTAATGRLAAMEAAAATGFTKAFGPGAASGVARFLPKTTLSALALGLGVSALLVQALQDGFSQGVEKAKQEAGQKAKKDLLTQKGLELANSPPADYTTDIHGIPEAAYNVKQFFTGGKSKEAQLTDQRQRVQSVGLVALFKEIQKQRGTTFKIPFSKNNVDSEATLKQLPNGTVDDDLFAGLIAFRDELVKKYGKKYINDIIKDLQKKARQKAGKGKFDTRAALKSGDQTDTETALNNRRADYDNGLIDEQQLRASYSTATAALKTLVETGAANKSQRAEYFKVRSDSSKFESDLIKQDLDAARQIRQYTGQETSEQNIQEAIAALRNPKLTNLQTRSDILGQIFADYQHILQTRIDSVTDAAQKLAIAQAGVSIDPEARVEIARARIATILEHSKAASRALRQISRATGEAVSQLQSEVNALAIYLGITIAEATKIYLQAQLKLAVDTLAGYQAALQYTGKISKGAKKAIEAQKAKIGALYGTLLEIANDPSLQVNPLEGVPTDVTATADQQAQLAAQAADQTKSDAKAILAARYSYLKALVEGDPVATAQLDLQQANEEYAIAENEADRWNAMAHQVQAQHALTDALNAITAARLDFLKQLVANDPVAAAEYDIKKAYFALLTAKSDADRYAAATQLASAQQAYRQTLFDIVASVSSIASAMANFAGDSVAAAQESLAQLQRQLAYQRTNGYGAADINNTQAQIIAAQAALRDAQLNSKEATIDFNLQVQKISTAQAISQYQALLSQADLLQLTTQQRRDLILKIQQLKQSLTQDLQFDLPTDLRLPTLYEARRLNQTGGVYQDNRTMTISLSSTDPASTEAAVSQIQDALNAPPVFGSGSRIY